MKKALALLLPLLALVVGAPTKAADELVSFRIMAPKLALDLAEAALADCRKRGFQVAVAVVDRFGVPQAMLRDTLAGPHTPDTAIAKARTAVSFRATTEQLSALTQAGQLNSAIRHIPGYIFLGGGVPVEAGGMIVGGIGISGAPSGTEDDACARAGIEAVEDRLLM
jgi:uncharacterized protein GlcG (DUF336 family)